MISRSAGLLAHISLLPSRYGIGDFGPEAYRLADFLSQSSIRFWQILPLNPTLSMMGNSPYSSYSAYAGNFLFISPEMLVELGWCDSKTIASHQRPPSDRVDFEPLYKSRHSLLREIFLTHQQALSKDCGFSEFCSEQSSWLQTFAQFVAIKEKFEGLPWPQWPTELRDRDKSALEKFSADHFQRIEQEKFTQYLFYQQWLALKNYCNDQSIDIIGDLPIYLSLDSADVWCRPDVFKLDSDKQPTAVAGVPPDYFSKTGQLWGNPVYDWKQLEKTGFDFWLDRIAHNFKLYDIFRFDHFRGLVAYWEIAAGEKTAINGHWEKVPLDSFTTALRERFPSLPVIAEDLGTITDDVKTAMKQLGWPGMRIFHFGFSGDLENHPYLPHNYIENCVAYCGTHDNNTTLGWFLDDIDDDLRKIVRDYLEFSGDDSEIGSTVMRKLLDSRANLVILSLPDLLGAGSEARLNQPSVISGNWAWRILPGLLESKLASDVRQWIKDSNRVNRPTN